MAKFSEIYFSVLIGFLNFYENFCPRSQSGKFRTFLYPFLSTGEYDGCVQSKGNAQHYFIFMFPFNLRCLYNTEWINRRGVLR